MDIFLLIIGFLFVLLGIIGSFLPVLPGPITGWVGLLLLHLTSIIPMNWTFLGVTLAIAIVIWIIDYVIPAMGTKKFGGTKLWSSRYYGWFNCRVVLFSAFRNYYRSIFRSLFRGDDSRFKRANESLKGCIWFLYRFFNLHFFKIYRGCSICGLVYSYILGTQSSFCWLGNYKLL